MTPESKAWRVGFVGTNPVGRFLIEQLSLEPNIRVVGTWDRNPSRPSSVAELGKSPRNPEDAAIAIADCDVIFFTEGWAEEDVSLALQNGRNVVLDRAWQLPVDALRRLSETAIQSQRQATTVCLRRWSSEFMAARAAQQGERLGLLNTVRVASFEKSVLSAPPFRGVLREFGYHWLDQLLLLTESIPVRVVAKQFFDAGANVDHGFLATIEFASSCTALIEVQSRSRLSFRTGWILEGSTGSFRGNRILTETTDGEIVDEPLPQTIVSGSPFVEELVRTWNGAPSNLPTLDDAARVIRLIEAIEQSAASNEVVLVGSSGE